MSTIELCRGSRRDERCQSFGTDRIAAGKSFCVPFGKNIQNVTQNEFFNVLNLFTWKYRPRILIFFDRSLPSFGICAAGVFSVLETFPLFNFRSGTSGIEFRFDFCGVFVVAASWLRLKFCRNLALNPFALLLFWFLLALSSFVALTMVLLSWFSVATLLLTSSPAGLTASFSVFSLLLLFCSHSCTSVIRFNDWLSLSLVSVCRRRPVRCFL